MQKDGTPPIVSFLTPGEFSNSVMGPAQTSAFELSDAPEAQSKARRSVPGSLSDRSLREIANSTERSLRQPATYRSRKRRTRTL